MIGSAVRLGDEGGDEVGDAERGGGVQDLCSRTACGGVVGGPEAGPSGVRGGQRAGQGLPGGAADGKQGGGEGRIQGGDRGQVAVANRALYRLVERRRAFVQVAGGGCGSVYEDNFSACLLPALSEQSRSPIEAQRAV